MRSSFTMRAGLALGALMVLALPAAAQNGSTERCVIKGKVPGRGHLQNVVPNLQIYSYNGRVIHIRPQVTRRTRDPMAVRGDNVHPGTTLKLQRQRHSRDVSGDLRGRLRCKDLPAIAERALVWSDAVTVKPDVRSRRDTFAELVKDPAKVFWPNSGVRVTGADRDGNPLKEVRTKATGMRAVNETIYNHATQRTENIRQSGDALPSSRAWAVTSNLLVSQPVRDVKAIGKGKHMVRKARRYRATHAQLQQWVTQAEADLAAGNYNDAPARKRKVQRGINTVKQKLNRNELISKANTMEAEGRKMIDGGRKLRSMVFSVGGTPLGAQVTLQNTRLAGEGARAVTARDGRQNKTVWTPNWSGSADLRTGSFIAEVGGIARDQVNATVAHQPVAGQSVGSRTTLSFEIPDPRAQRPVATMGHSNQKRRRIKLYPLQPTTVGTVNDPAITQ